MPGRRGRLAAPHSRRFFFSSRRRHTRFKCDWSSDVCSSDLCTSLGDACGGLARTLTAPVSSALPEVHGMPQAGEVLLGTVGAWQNAPTSYRVQWQQELAPGAWYDVLDGDEFPVGLLDVGTRLRTVVTASNADGSTLATSAPTAPVTAPAALGSTSGTPTPDPAPVVTTAGPGPRATA